MGIFGLVSSLFFLWALCNGMIDVMDKHFQDFLHLTKAQSAWVQFAHYLGYFLMAIRYVFFLGWRWWRWAVYGLFLPPKFLPSGHFFWEFV